MAIKKMKKTNTIHFGIQRKIVANMTTESWENIPHVTYNYEPDVTEFMIEYQRLNAGAEPKDKITLNTLMLKIITEGLKANPIMNSHIEFDKKLVRGEIQTFEDINISMPMVLPSGEMMTINLHNFENKNLNEMVHYINDVNRRVANTDLNEVMFDVSLDNTLTALKKGNIKQTLFRLIGSKTGKHKVKTLSGKAKHEYYKIPEEDRLTKRDIEQGTITVSNIGSVYRNQRGETCLLEIIPPQVCAIALGAVQDKPVVVVNEAGEKEIAIRQIMPLCIAFDHRALDFGEIVPFLKKLDEIFEAPEIIHTWKDGGVEEVDMEEIKNERVERETKYQESKEREKARKEAEKAAEKAKREAEKAKRAEEKAAEKAKKEAEKAAKEAEEAKLKAEEKAKKEAEKAAKEAEEAEEKARKEAEKAKKEAEEAKAKAEEKARKE
ncbi:MAG: 2-oxo acid dehydrogenase subunit E2, partial [Eubacterium sp.]|nr:2-oxo acid dehydrogenase subunit E2 [Eubacterium sp.]